MSHVVKKLGIVTVVAVVVVALIGWLFLSSPLFSGPRKALTGWFLSQELGRKVEVVDDVRITVGPGLHIAANGIVLPSEAMPDVQLLEIGALEFDIAFADLRKRQVVLHNLRADGVKAMLVVDKDGTSSAQSVTPASPDVGASGTGNDGLSGLFADNEVELLNVGFVYRDARNGLDLDLLLDTLKLSRQRSPLLLEIQAAGRLNDQALTLAATMPQGEEFNASAVFDGIKIDFVGTPDPAGYAAGFSVAANADVSDLGQLLDVLKLEHALGGVGHVSAVFENAGGINKVNNLNVVVTLDGGQSVEVKGNIGELGNPADVSLFTGIRLFPKDNVPPPTRSRRDLKLVAVDMVIDSVPGKIPQRKMLIETNGFVLDTAGVGPPPIFVRKIRRTADGKLQLGQVQLRIGPPEAPFLVLDGKVDDALNLQGISATGTLEIPAGSLLSPDMFHSADALGVFSGGFNIAGNYEKLSLSGLSGKTRETDLWDLQVSGSIENALRFDTIALNVAVEVPSSASLLSAMSLEPLEAGPASLYATLKSEGHKWSAEAGVRILDSHVNFEVNLDEVDEKPLVRGKISSELIKVKHLRDIIAVAVQLGRLDDVAEAKAQKDGTTTENKTVVPEPASPFRDVTLYPLGKAVLLSGLDLDVALDLNRIEGAKGVSSIHSGLEMKDRKLDIGPVKFEYGGGYFDLHGSMDLAESPDQLRLKGTTGGWEFAEILEVVHFKKSASGTLHANFEVAGNTTSVRDYLRSLDGYATISMNNGKIDTQLLDIAGLGVIPWLFSKERQAQAAIACLHAPLSINSGKISTKTAVLETDQVQIVVFGHVNLITKAMDITGQPRKIGHPLSRSPWPFTAKGSFAKPDVKVKDGPRRLRRKDGASTMPKTRKPCVPDILQLQ